MAEMKAASTRGKKFNQKIKPYVVLQYLLKYSDKNNIVTGPDIVAFLEEHGNEVERRHGDKYIVSPYALLINDGNYYLLAVDDKFKKPHTYRIDRMKEVSLTGKPRTGEEHFKDVDIRTYTQRVFGMYGGNRQLVTIRFINPLLDTAVERFGTKDTIYAKVDDRHFSVTAHVEISDLFYGWLLGFGKRVKLTYPDDAVEGFKAYLDKVRAMYA